jgi:tetratricopeptide (TPR) repeat protein
MGRASRAKRIRRLNAGGNRPPEGGGPGVRPGVRHSSYTITYEPLDDKYKLPPEVDEQYPELHDLALRQPEQAVPRLEALLERFPDVPQLYNLLSAAYAGTGRPEKSDEVTELNYRKAPDYFFARIGYAGVLLGRGQAEAAEDVLGHTWDLKEIFPGREIFHVSEAMAFLSLVGRFNVDKGKWEAIPRIYEAMKKLAPEHPATQGMGKLAMAATLQQAMARLRAGRPGHPRADNRSKHRPPLPQRGKTDPDGGLR